MLMQPYSTNFVLHMSVMDQVCNANLHRLDDVKHNATRSFDVCLG